MGVNKTLSDCLRNLGEEEVTININGEEITCSRTEATARRLYLMANGGYEQITNAEGEPVVVPYKPNYQASKAIREFTEGRPAPQAVAKDKGRSKARKYSSEIGQRLNERLGVITNPKRPRVDN